MANFKSKSKLQADAGVVLPQETKERVLTVDANGEVKSSSVSTTTLSHLDATSSVQDQLNDNAQAISDHVSDTADAHAASAISFDNSASLGYPTNVQGAIVQNAALLAGHELELMNLEAQAQALETLSGVTSLSENLGTFTGSTIPNDSTIKGALQALETAQEGIATDLSTNYVPLTQKASANGVATLGADGKIPAGQIPAMAISETFVVASEAAMLALVAQTGDIAIRSDLSQTFILQGSDPAELTDWVVLQTPASPVLSVNGKVGAVVLSTDDVAEGSNNLYYTDARVQSKIESVIKAGDAIDVEKIGSELFIGVNVSGSIEAAPEAISLVNDSATPGNSKYYGTNAAGAKGFHDLPKGGSAGDIQETSFAGANDVTALSNVTGFAFANASVRSFEALVSVVVSATEELVEVFTLRAVQKSSGWDMSITSTGDDSLVSFDITSAGQIQYVSGDYDGFTALEIRFRAITTTKV